MSLGGPASRIRRSVSGDRSAVLLQSVHDHELPAELRGLITEYESLPESRPRFLWRWVHHLAPANTMPFVEKRHVAAVATDKTMLVCFITLLDDLVERRADHETFDALADLVRPGGGDTGVGDIDTSDSEVDEAYATVTAHAWETLAGRIQQGQEYDRYAPLFRFDVRQVLTSVKYSSLAIERPGLAAASDLRRYETHNMGVCAFADIDLMHSPVTLGEDRSAFQDAVHAAQRIARIGNWLSTWERELHKGDTSSGVVIAAIKRRLLNTDDLTADESVIANAADRIAAHDIGAELSPSGTTSTGGSLTGPTGSRRRIWGRSSRGPRRYCDTISRAAGKNSRGVAGRALRHRVGHSGREPPNRSRSRLHTRCQTASSELFRS